MTDSIAANYFEKFTTRDAASILSELPNAHPKIFEDNWLDFKSGQPMHLEEIWSKALGAMSNAGGGVIVWGIDARKHGKPPIDAAEKMIPVLDVDVFASRLRELMRFATDPPVAGVQIRPIPFDAGTKEGFVVCLIPEGATKPYQSLRAKRSFYIRMGDESREAPLPILKELFFPKARQRVSLLLSAQKSVPELFRLGGKELGIEHKGKCITVGVKNVGEFTLEDVVLLVKCGEGALVTWKQDRFEKFWGDAWFVDGGIEIGGSIHPGLSRIINVIKLGDVPQDEVEWSFKIFAKDMSPKEVVAAHRLLPVETGTPLILPFE